MINAVGAHIYAGGFTVGVARHFNVLCHLEHAAYGADVMALNFPHIPVIAGGPSEWRKFPFPTGRDRVRFVYANPPCALWASSSHGRSTAWHEDPRLQMHHDVFGLLEFLAPDVFALESVPPFFTKGRAHADSLIAQAAELGYSTTVVKHDAQWFDVAQARKRVFMVFHNVAIEWHVPLFDRQRTVRDAIGKLKLAKSRGYDTAMPPDLELLARNAREGETLRAVFDRLYPNAPLNARGQVAGRPSFLDIRFPWDKPGPIVIGGKPIHPSEARYMSQEELAAVCSFPPDYKWPRDTFGEISSLMSRGVMPNVGDWLADNVARAIDANKRLNDVEADLLDITTPRVIHTDLPPATISSTPEVRARQRVLLTGATPMQIGSDRTQLKIVTAAVAWRNALEDMGYDVDHRAVTPGEDLSGYAAVIAILNQPNSLAASYIYGAIWALLARPDAIIALDDWQIKEVLSGAQTYARSRERAFRIHAVPDMLKDVLHDGICELAEGNWRWPVIVPILGDGDVSLLEVPAQRVVAIDPTAYAPRYDAPIAARREKRWVQATLLKKPAPIATSWPVIEYGPLARVKGGGGGAGENASQRLSESDLMHVYASSWGVLSPAHPHAGSGWWRVRYLMARDAGAILSADAREAACLGAAYTMASDPARVERLSNVGLIDLANAQRRAFDAITWPKARVKQELQKLIKGENEMARTPKPQPQSGPPAREPGEGSGAYIRRLLQAGVADATILERVHAQFPGSKAKQSDINWNRRKLKDENGAGITPRPVPAQTRLPLPVRRPDPSPPRSVSPTPVSNGSATPPAPPTRHKAPDNVVAALTTIVEWLKQ